MGKMLFVPCHLPFMMASLVMATTLFCLSASPLVSSKAAGPPLALDLGDPRAVANSRDITAPMCTGVHARSPMPCGLRAKRGTRASTLRPAFSSSLGSPCCPRSSLSPFPWLKVSEGRGPLAKYPVTSLARATPWTSGSQNPELNVNVLSLYILLGHSFSGNKEPDLLYLTICFICGRSTTKMM